MAELHKCLTMMLFLTSTSKSSFLHPQFSVMPTCSYFCVCKFLLHFDASVIPGCCVVHSAAQYELSHGDGASCSSLQPALLSCLPCLHTSPRSVQEFMVMAATKRN